MILVEGPSDQVALETLAKRRGCDLEAMDVQIVPMGGATNVRVYLDSLRRADERILLAGLCDAGEIEMFRKGLMRAGMGKSHDLHDMAERGFFVCHRDLEDELIRALGTERVLDVFDSDGRLGKFRGFQHQVAQRELPVEAQLLGFVSNWKIHFARLFAEALDENCIPEPLDGVLSHVGC